MIRPSLFVVSHNSSMTNSLSKYFSVIGPAFIKHDFNPESHSLTYSFIEEIHDFLSKNEPDQLLNSAVIFDYTDGLSLTSADNLDPTAQGDSKGSILSQLILAYPEVYWIILGTDHNDPSAYDSTPFVPNVDDPRNVHWEEHFVKVQNVGHCFYLLQRHQNGYRTIFDPSVIRSIIKLVVLNKHKSQGRESAIKNDTRDILKSRIAYCAAALDEELAYTFLNGYTAYRFGYRCYTVTSMAEMEKLNNEKREVNFALEDLELKYSDMITDSDPQKDHETLVNGGLDSAALISRRINYPFIPANHLNRIIITGAQNKLGEFPICRKPFSGMFDLHEKIKKTDTYKNKINGNNNRSKVEEEKDKSISIKKLGFWAQLFTKKQTGKHNSNTNKPKSHSATNKIVTIGEILLERARIIVQSADTCPKAIYAATLALEGKELLYGRTMTTSLEMVAMQYKMEVTAECCFLGIGSEIVVDKRVSELARTVDKILRIEDKTTSYKQYSQSYNAQAEIISNMRLIYKEYEQFDEEDFCINWIRQLLQGLHFYGSTTKLDKKTSCIDRHLPTFKRITLAFLTFFKKRWILSGERYFNFLMRSGGNILFAILLCISIFAAVFMWIDNNFKFGWSPVFDSFFRSAETFFSIQPFGSNVIVSTKEDLKLTGYLFNTVSLVEMIFGYFHLGIFIAWLYQKLARR